jgi:hypothetical protein
MEQGSFGMALEFNHVVKYELPPYRVTLAGSCALEIRFGRQLQAKSGAFRRRGGRQASTRLDTPCAPKPPSALQTRKL